MTLDLTFKGWDYPAFLNYPYYYNGNDVYDYSLGGVAGSGANAVALGADWGIDAQNSTIYADPARTDPMADLSTAILQAESLGLTVMVRPAIDLLDPTFDGTLTGDWRDTYIPTDPAAFFASYETMIVATASLAQADGAQMLDIGTELDQLTGPQYLSEWTTIISAVRQVYSGELTYSANWDTDLSPWTYSGAPAGTGNLATQISFWNQLDFIGIDEYAPTSDAANPSLQDLINGWTQAPTDPLTAAVTGGQSLINYYESLSAEVGKPLLFTEIGYQDASDAAQNVVTSQTNVMDAALQSSLYTAFFDAWEQSGNDSLHGTFAWYWNPDPTQDGVNSSTVTFSPQGLPAQTAITDAYRSTETGPVSTAACYVRGTRIATADGERAIETLAEGDLVLTAAGEARPLVWLGHRAIDTTRHPDPSAVWPVLVRAGALAEGQPAHDLWLSPGHRIVIDGVLIPIELLCNGQMIHQVRCRAVEYWHVELPTHDMIRVHGLLTETYLDTGNRNAFTNGGDFITQYPDFRPKHWAETCLPLVAEGPLVHRAKTRLLQRLSDLGYALTDEHDMQVVADGKPIAPLPLTALRVAYVLPEGCSHIRLRSRTFVPAHVIAESTDPRSLGVCVGRLQIDGQDLPLDSLQVGWHASEPDHRWTDGFAKLPAGARLIVIDLIGSGAYFEDVEDIVGRKHSALRCAVHCRLL